ncbi:hypothetical protein SARI_03927 [Salmonella enterica subsp. arizonae serovar 62:z4,z23:-]|uniref:Uncharacterized protein n=1 Tax=Salmonella arizonae (strain ATCC BAA-731 / CDC346-86 / RSK2980) TaxID=41514 RepID=A9MKQ2_SALAR|nr:hypothetical protein SARI_03927 [Salmonella enterica subsp. arizonae serovar 62:z4,z23:-]
MKTQGPLHFPHLVTLLIGKHTVNIINHAVARHKFCEVIAIMPSNTNPQIPP